MPDKGHVTLNGKDYRIDLATYRASDIVDFAPRAGTPGGSILHSELGLYQPLLQTDWRHGFGFQWYTDASGFMRSDGDIDTRHAGVVMRMTQPTSSDTNNSRKEGMCIFNGRLFTWGPGGLRDYNGTTWANTSGITGAVNFCLPTGAYLFVLMDGALTKRVQVNFTTVANLEDASATDFKWAIIHGGFLFFGKDATSRIHYTDGPLGLDDGSDLEGDTADPDLKYVGAGGFATLGATIYGTKMYVFRPDGIWQFENFLATQVLDYSNEASSNNFRSWATYRGLLTYPIRDRIMQWNGARESDITPPQWSDTFPYGTYGRFDNFVTQGRFLYVTARTNQSPWVEDLLCWDGVGWHRLLTLVPSSTTASVTAGGFDAFNNRLWFHVEDTAGSDVNTTYFIQIQDLSDYPYSDFLTSGAHDIISSRLDMGFRRVKKSVPSILFEVSNVLTSASRHLLVYYSIDGGSWTAWGGTGGTTNKLTAGSVAPTTIELSDPLGTGNSTLEFYYLQIKVELVTATAAQTPVLEGMTVRFIMRPEVAYGHAFTVILEDFQQFGGLSDDRSVNDLITNLRTARDSKAPLAFVDPFGGTRQVYVSALVEYLQEMNVDDNVGGVPSYSGLMQVNCVEV